MLSSAAPATADDTHYQDYPLGGRAVGLGGAFVALSDDPSGLFYNPAGIVDARGTSVQLSTNLYGLEIADSFFSAFGRVADLDTVFADLNIIPSSASGTTVLAADASGRPTDSYGFGVFVPSYRSLNVSNLSAVPDAEINRCNQIAYQRSTLDRTFLAGGAFAHRLDDHLRFGVSGFLSYRSLRDREETACFTGSSETSPAFASAETSLDLAVASMLVSLGLLAEWPEGWRFGLAVTTPSIRVYDFANVRVRRDSADLASGRAQSFFRELADLDADTREGLGLRAGAAYVLKRRATLSLDLSMHAPTRYRLFDVRGAPQRVREALTTVSEVERRWVVNVNAGGEYVLAYTEDRSGQPRPELSLSAGLWTNFTSAPAIPGSRGDLFTADRLPHMHVYGGSLVLGLFGDYTLTRAGLTLAYGDGTDVVPRSAELAALGAPTEYVKVDFSQLSIYLFISSTFRY